MNSSNDYAHKYDRGRGTETYCLLYIFGTIKFKQTILCYFFGALAITSITVHREIEIYYI